MYLKSYLRITIFQKFWYKENLVFGSKSVLLSFIYEASTKLDIFFIGFFLSNYYVGIYSFASSIGVGLLSFASVVQLNINPIISDLWHKKNISAIQQYTSRITKVMFWVSIFIFIFAAVIYPVFIHIFMYEESYKESIPVFYILLIGLFFPSVTYFSGAYLSMANLLNTSFILQVMRIAFNILSCYVFIKMFGFYGAAIATSVTLVFSVLVGEYFMRKKMQVKILSWSNFFS